MGTETFRNIAVGTPSGNDEYIVVLIAREYDSTRTYARGDYCVKAGQAYRCINAIAAPQVWTPANWTAVYFGDELARIAREGGGGGGGGDVYPYDSNPAALGTAAPGVSEDYARGDHVHPKPSAADIGALATTGGTMSGNLAMGSYKITGLADAQNSGDAVNKGQLDAAIQGIGTVFNIKGDVATVSDLPATGNTVGDVYYVASVSAGYIWLETTDHPTGYWEELGEPIDLSGYIEKPAAPSTGDFLVYNGTAWTAQTVPSANGVNF